MIIGIPKEIKSGEQRVAMIPANVESLTVRGLKVLLQAGAGAAAGYPDADYLAAGASVTEDRAVATATVRMLPCAL